MLLGLYRRRLSRRQRPPTKPIASLDQSDLEFLVPADHDMYIDLNIQIYIRSKLKKADGTDLDDKDDTCVVKIYYIPHSNSETYP